MLHKMIRALIADSSVIARDVVRAGIKFHCEKRYFEIHEATCGSQTLDLLTAKPIDIAFLDIDMPDLNCCDVFAAIQETRSRGCLTVAMSGNLEESVEETLTRCGAYHFLKKPFRPEDVADIVKTYMRMTEPCPILIVDDSATMRKLTRNILENSRFNFKIAEASNAAEALKAVASGRFRIVLTDFHMPDVDGIELAGSIKNLSSKVSIYMMSTNDTTYLERSAAFVGIEGFLKKPFTSEDIDTLMHKLLGLDPPRFGKMRELFGFMEREKRGVTAQASLS
jgi:two-component system chemotaxis response regulator CheY